MIRNLIFVYELFSRGEFIKFDDHNTFSFHVRRKEEKLIGNGIRDVKSEQKPEENIKKKITRKFIPKFHHQTTLQLRFQSH